MSKSISPVDANRTLAENFNGAVFGDHDLSILEEFLATDVVHRESGEIVFEGIEAAREYFEAMLTAFPNVEIDVVESVVDDERVMQHFELTATNDGPVSMGEDLTLEPTGERLSWTGFVSMRIDGDGISEISLLTDDLALYRGLGAIPVGELSA